MPPQYVGLRRLLVIIFAIAMLVLGIVVLLIDHTRVIHFLAWGEIAGSIALLLLSI